MSVLSLCSSGGCRPVAQPLRAAVRAGVRLVALAACGSEASVDFSPIELPSRPAFNPGASSAPAALNHEASPAGVVEGTEERGEGPSAPQLRPAPTSSAQDSSSVPADAPEPEPQAFEPTASDAEPLPTDAASADVVPADGVAEAPTPDVPVRCPAPSVSTMLDFSGATAAAEGQGLFGDFFSQFSGGTYVYPLASSAAVAPLGLTSDVSEGDWHIVGTVAEAAGFGLFFNCQLLDASRFEGIGFTVQGGLASPQTVTLMVGTAGNDIAAEWLEASGDSGGGPSFGRCVPASGRYDGTCAPARLSFEVGPEPRSIEVRFDDLGFGSPSAGVDAREVTWIAWTLPVPAQGPGGQPEAYATDVRFDDIRWLMPATSLAPQPVE